MAHGRSRAPYALQRRARGSLRNNPPKSYDSCEGTHELSAMCVCAQHCVLQVGSRVVGPFVPLRELVALWNLGRVGVRDGCWQHNSLGRLRHHHLPQSLLLPKGAVDSTPQT